MLPSFRKYPYRYQNIIRISTQPPRWECEATRDQDSSEPRRGFLCLRYTTSFFVPSVHYLLYILTSYR